MVHLFQHKILNGAFGDPALYISLFGKSYSYLVDLGDIFRLSNKQVLNIKSIFVTHTHMDHFYGFDRVIRTFLGKNKRLSVFGPKNIIKNVHGKLQGYTWNLVENYNTNFTVEVFEIYNTKMKRAIFKCKKKFKKETLKDITLSKGIILKNDDHTVKGIVLDHKTPCISYVFEERFHINILKKNMKNLNLESGKWLTTLKNYIYENQLEKTLEVDGKKFKVQYLKDNITKITEGEKLAYITDIQFSKKNVSKIKKNFNEITFLYIEAPFLNSERKRAKERYHLTARQAGYIAKILKAKHFFPFHVSPLHTGEYHVIKKEIKAEFQRYPSLCEEKK
jgi:ribonuclease Z